jgi:hypothetical protein
VLAACGGFLAALGIAFTVIAQSRLALAFTLSGLFIVAAGLYVEIGSLLGQAIQNIGKASKEAADRRLRAKELAIEKKRLDLEALSCKGRGVCPSRNGRRMAQTAAHLVDRVIPPVPVRQWVISVPKRLRCYLADLVPPQRKHRYRPPI